MAIGTKERTELREELVNQGYSWEYIDEWQPKTTLYRHREMLSPDGAVVSPAGTALRNMPGNPDYVNRKGLVGLFTYYQAKPAHAGGVMRETLRHLKKNLNRKQRNPHSAELQLRY